MMICNDEHVFVFPLSARLKPSTGTGPAFCWILKDLRLYNFLISFYFGLQIRIVPHIYIILYIGCIILIRIKACGVMTTTVSPCFHHVFSTFGRPRWGDRHGRPAAARQRQGAGSSVRGEGRGSMSHLGETRRPRGAPGVPWGKWEIDGHLIPGKCWDFMGFHLENVFFWGILSNFGYFR